MRAWHFLSVVNLLVAAVTLAAVVTFRAMPVSVTVAAPVAVPISSGLQKFEFARFQYIVSDDPTVGSKTELEWIDKDGIKISEEMPSLLNQLAKSKNRFPKDVSTGLVDLMNLAGELGWDVIDVQDFHSQTQRLLEVYFRRVRN